MKHTLFAAVVAVMSGITPAMAEMTDIKFTLGWKTQGSDAPFLVALNEGYFEEEGLNVTIDQGEGSAATVTRVMSGAYDAGFGDINAIIQNAAARPGEALSDSHILVDFLPHIPCELSAVLDGLEIGPA
jgi:NitT/TauT family transport system substrate-binding protein